MAEERPRLSVQGASLESIFLETDDGKYYRRVKATGAFSTTGLSTAMEVTTMTVGTTPTKIPATPLSGRNSISIHNISDTETLYISTKATVTADRTIGTTAGWEVFPESIYNIDITDGIELYGVVGTGTITVKVMEVA